MRESIPRLRLSLLPTPFHKLERLSSELGVSVYCKRDDLTGFGFGGNKTRKLDYLIADAMEKRATDIIATGGVQSNFCRMAAAYASHAGCACHLVLGASETLERASGNLLLDDLFGAEVHRVPSDDWSEWENRAAELEARLVAAGRKPYRMLIGGSTPLGALGYVDAFDEILRDARRLNLRVDRIVHASSSGGTQAGLIMGAAIARWQGKIHGIAVAKNDQPLGDVVRGLLSDMKNQYGLRVEEREPMVDERWIGPAYAEASSEGKKAQRMFARLEGIVLDDVYTAKAAAGLIGLCRSGEIGRDETVVFLHTGGSPQVFSRERIPHLDYR